MKDLKDSGLVTQLVVVATMMPKVKQYIDDLIAENEALKMEIHSLTYGERLAEYLKKAKG